MRALSMILALTLVGCANPTKPDLPPPTGKPIHTVTTQVRYVPIDAALTAPCEIATSRKLSEAPQVARERKAALEECNAKLGAIRTIQGTPSRSNGRNPTH